jgi:glycosyltransferase involved in cell wall biosynthesis
VVSILLLNIGRPEMYDITMPKWLAQEGVEFEIIYGHGPLVPVPDDPRVKPIPMDKFAMCANYNRLLAEAKGEFLLVTQSDMEVNDPRQIAKMAEAWRPGRMVTERFIKDGKRDPGIFIQFMYIKREDFEPWCEDYDNPEVYGCEDSDIVCRLLRKGMRYTILETEDDLAVRHIWHPSPDYTIKANMDKVVKAKELLFKRQGSGIYRIFAEEFAKQMMEKRHAQV